MNNEPVAWMYDFNGTKAFAIDALGARSFQQNPTPLYTHPAKTPTLVLDGNRVYPTAKTLTDEEIKQVWQENLVAMGNDLDFARAILRKAQEK